MCVRVCVCLQQNVHTAFLGFNNYRWGQTCNLMAYVGSENHEFCWHPFLIVFSSTVLFYIIRIWYLEDLFHEFSNKNKKCPLKLATAHISSSWIKWIFSVFKDYFMPTNSKKLQQKIDENIYTNCTTEGRKTSRKRQHTSMTHNSDINKSQLDVDNDQRERIRNNIPMNIPMPRWLCVNFRVY